jgi:hypothetical protein
MSLLLLLLLLLLAKLDIWTPRIRVSHALRVVAGLINCIK